MMFVVVAFVCLVGVAVAEEPPIALLQVCAANISMTVPEMFKVKDALTAKPAPVTGDDVANFANSTMIEAVGSERAMQFYGCVRDSIERIFSDCAALVGVSDDQKTSVKEVLKVSFDKFKTLSKEQADTAKAEVQKQIEEILGADKAAQLQICIETAFKSEA